MNRHGSPQNKEWFSIIRSSLQILYNSVRQPVLNPTLCIHTPTVLFNNGVEKGVQFGGVGQIKTSIPGVESGCGAAVPLSKMSGFVSVVL